MNRSDFIKLAEVRVREAGALLGARCYDGAYYLGGYAVEFGLKACIAKKTRRHDYPPPRNIVDNYYTHSLNRLLTGTGIKDEFERAVRSDRNFEIHWTIVEKWSEESRYRKHSRQDAVDLYKAVTDTTSGIMPWLRARW